MKDMYHDLPIVSLLVPTALAHTDQTSLILDTAGFEGARILAHVGTLTGQDTSNYTLATLQESATTVGTDFTDVAAADQITDSVAVKTTALDETVYRLAYKGSKRYIRVKFVTTTAGSYPTGYVSATGELGFARHAPATAPTAITAT